MKLQRILSLVLLLAVGACATIPLEPQPKAPAEDLSQPNPASMYFFSAGSFLYYSGDFAGADQVLTLALAHDPASFQIRKLLLVNSLRWYLTAEDELSAERAESMLKLAKISYDFDEEMLILAYSAYRNLEDPEGVAWALSRLKAEHPRPQVYIWEYLHLADLGELPPISLLEKALSYPDRAPQIDYIVSSLYIQRDPNRALEILEAAERDASADFQLIRLYRHLGMIKELNDHFAQYSYPEAKESMGQYLMLCYESGLDSLVTKRLPELLETGDAELLEIFAYIAFMTEDTGSLADLADFLSEKIAVPQEDSKIVAILALSSIKDPDLAISDELWARIYRIQDLIQASFIYVSQERYSEDRANAYQNAFRDLHEAVLKAPLPPKMKNFMKDHSASLAGIYDADSQSAIDLAEDLISRGHGGREDFDLVMDHYMLRGDIPAQMRILRKALQRFPKDPVVKNNLGYLLLDDPSRLIEAERLITEALREDPENISFLDSMAWLRYQKGEYQKALDYVPRLLAYDQPNAELFYHIGMIFLKNGELEEAHKYLSQALELPDPAYYHERSQIALRDLEEGRN
jgi:tetratricopeptide (TPR) repeat protein